MKKEKIQDFRLSLDEYVAKMNNLKLTNPKMMDLIVPANNKGMTLEEWKKIS